jgi:hypothetical protein
MPVQVAGTEFVVQTMQQLVTTGITPVGSHNVQLSQSGRVVNLVAVSQGNVYFAIPGDTAWTQAVNNTGESPPLNFTGKMYSTALNQKLWYCDGTNYCYFDPSTGSINSWYATAGAMPRDSEGNGARLICTWRGCTMLSGLLNDPLNWFKSATNDPTNWNYNPVPFVAGQAAAGNASPLGVLGEPITALVPYSDDLLIFGLSSQIWIMSGDPTNGGSLDLVTNAIGMAFGLPWCTDPYGTVYFFSNRVGIYTLVPGYPPVRISQAIEQLLFGVNTGTNSIEMLWSDRFQGLHVFITPLAAPMPTYHLFYETRTGAWWLDQFSSAGMDPMCCCVLDGNGPDDRVPLLGCNDGYVRALNPAALDDDGVPINSYVVLGPILTANLDSMTLKSLQAVLGETSGQVQYDIYGASSAELAVQSPSLESGQWQPGRNLTEHIRHEAHAIYVKISASQQWAMESIRALIKSNGKVRMRGH